MSEKVRLSFMISNERKQKLSFLQTYDLKRGRLTQEEAIGLLIDCAYDNAIDKIRNSK
ncbi:hypothetical protein GPZ88_10040 (plasmid) [Streptococcus ruminicola]|uniref:Uncharacterized protein n=1 Tax=Streptococcus ruminicola TaxID=2686210 RepID=A0A6G8I2P3_9STRE|nr:MULTISPECIES: hypothetical protein [Streptococcus]QGX47358.1 hypothetical protein GPA00_09495 [Streptococcus equinus]QIM47407.1 hypothetical protein GPZ88_10040 [Streptococcus ruminicola]